MGLFQWSDFNDFNDDGLISISIYVKGEIPVFLLGYVQENSFHSYVQVFRLFCSSSSRFMFRFFDFYENDNFVNRKPKKKTSTVISVSGQRAKHNLPLRISRH